MLLETSENPRNPTYQQIDSLSVRHQPASTSKMYVYMVPDTLLMIPAALLLSYIDYMNMNVKALYVFCSL